VASTSGPATGAGTTESCLATSRKRTWAPIYADLVISVPGGGTGPALEAHVYRVPLRTRFRGIDVRDGVLVHGPAGWGEFSPFWDYDDAESRRWWAAAYESAVHGWPAAVRDRVPVNVTVPAVGPEQAHAIVTASGCRTAKVKVAEPGQSEADDLARVEAVRDALGPDGAIRVDANAAWDVDTAVARIRALDEVGLEYVEQPCATLEDLAALRRRIDVRVAADEVVRRAGDPLAVDLRAACDVVVLKAQPLGGVRAALAVAEAHGLPCVVSSALESSVGIAAGVALAAALPDLPFACGLATVALFTGDVSSTPLLPVDGFLPVTRPEPDALATVAADPDTEARWRARMARVAAR
jgi:o-succinylbenzoate synthase